MILSESEEERRCFRRTFYSEKTLRYFEAMGERPVTIRLLDPPLHEFLPHDDESIAAKLSKWALVCLN